MAQIHACHAGSFLVLIEEITDEDRYPPEGVSEPDRGVANKDSYFDDGFDDEIEDSNRIFIAHVARCLSTFARTLGGLEMVEGGGGGLDSTEVGADIIVPK
jgi:hypothetical protein